MASDRDIEPLAEVDEAHETLGGACDITNPVPGTDECNQLEYQRLAGNSVTHLYNLRSARDRKWRVVFQKTRPRAIAIGERRKPEPGGQPGYIRMDTVHHFKETGTD